MPCFDHTASTTDAEEWRPASASRAASASASDDDMSCGHSSSPSPRHERHATSPSPNRAAAGKWNDLCQAATLAITVSDEVSEQQRQTRTRGNFRYTRRRERRRRTAPYLQPLSYCARMVHGQRAPYDTYVHK